MEEYIERYYCLYVYICTYRVCVYIYIRYIFAYLRFFCFLFLIQSYLCQWIWIYVYIHAIYLFVGYIEHVIRLIFDRKLLSFKGPSQRTAWKKRNPRNPSWNCKTASIFFLHISFGEWISFSIFLLKMRYRRGFLATTTWWARLAAKTESRRWRWLGCFCIWVVVSNITPIWGRFPFSNGLKPPTRYAFVLLISFFFVFRFPQTNIEVAIGSPKNYEIIGTVKAIASCNPWGFSRCYRYQRQVSWRLLPRCPT